MRAITLLVGCTVLVAALIELGGCASSGVTARVGVGYHRGFYGPRPWGFYGRDVIIVAPDRPEPALPIEPPLEAVTLPTPDFDMDFGVPDAFFMDF